MPVTSLRSRSLFGTVEMYDFSEWMSDFFLERLFPTLGDRFHSFGVPNRDSRFCTLVLDVSHFYPDLARRVEHIRQGWQFRRG